VLAAVITLIVVAVKNLPSLSSAKNEVTNAQGGGPANDSPGSPSKSQPQALTLIPSKSDKPDQGVRIALSPSGKTAVTSALFKPEADLWEVTSGKKIRPITVQQNEGRVSGVVVSPDDKYLAFGFAGKKAVVLVDASTGQRLLDLEGDGAVTHNHKIAFSKDGTLLAAAFFRQMKVWKVSSGDQVAVIPTAPRNIMSVAFSSDSSLLATGEHDGSTTIWSVAGQAMQNTNKVHKSFVPVVAFSPDGSLLASGGNDAKIHLWSGRRASFGPR
jgi:WD40 repeat protein